jgi:O-antigen ligase
MKKKIIEWLIYVSVIIVPLIFLPQVNSVFAAPKLYIFRVITLLIILLWGVKCLFADKLKVRFSKFFWFVIAYALISIVNTFVTVNFFTSLFGTYGRFLGIFTVINLLFWVYIVFTFINTREKIIKLIWFSVITAFVVAAYGLLQYFDLFVNIIPWTMDPMDRVFSTIGHSNHTAAYLGMNLMLLLALIFNDEHKKWKNLLWVGFALVSLTLILTASRGGVFAVIIAGIIWLLFILKNKKLSKKTFKFTIIGLILTAIIGILLSGPISKIGIVERTTSTISFILEGHMPDRVSWWLSSFEMIADKPFLGHGLSTFKDVYNKYRRTDYRVPDDLQDNITPESAHNEYLNIAATQGILGFLLYAAMLFVLLMSTIKYIKKADQKDKIIALGLLTALLVYLIEVFISFGTVMTLFFFYTIAGLLISFINLHVRISDYKNNLFYRIFIIILTVGLVVLCGIYSFFEFSADYYFKQGAVYASKGELENTIHNYDKAIKLMPYIVEYHEGYADFLFEFGLRMPADMQDTFLMDAANKYEEAEILNSNFPNIIANRALVLSRLADINRDNEAKYKQYSLMSQGLLLHAKSVAKNNPFYYYKTAQGFEYFGEYGQAYDYYKEVLELRHPYKDTAEKIQLMKQLDPNIIEAEDSEPNELHLEDIENLPPGEYASE